MEEAAEVLSGVSNLPGKGLAVHVLTGRRFWYQTAFCLYSLAISSKRRVQAVIYDDGTLDDQFRRSLDTLLGDVVFVGSSETEKRMEEILPEGRFPILRERWRSYPHIRKLVNPHLGSSGAKLVLDSDLLFYHSPLTLLDWIGAPTDVLHAIDCRESYGYSRGLMERLAAAPIPPLVNVGVCGLKSELLNWAEIEAWCGELIGSEGYSYFLEQALVAMIAARSASKTVLPASDYITFPGKSETMRPTAVMHHFVAGSKRWYYQYAWRNLRNVELS